MLFTSQNEAIESKDNLLGGPSQISQNLSSWIARQLNLDAVGVAGAVRLFQEGSTLPFIARKLGGNKPLVGCFANNFINVCAWQEMARV